MIQHGYDRVNLPIIGAHLKMTWESKFYAPKIISFGRVRHLKKVFKTASEAEKYAERFAKTMERLLMNG